MAYDVLLYGVSGATCRGLGEVYSVVTPVGKKTFTDKAEYEKYKEYANDYDTAYGIAYTYNLNPPNWADFEAGNGKAVIDAYRAATAGSVQKNTSTGINQTTGEPMYSILLPVDGNKYFKTTDKAEYEKYTQYVALFNDCYAIATKYGFSKPVWAQFEAGQGENVLQQYKTLEANKLTSDKEEAARIAAAAAERSKAEAEAAAALAANKAAKLELQAANNSGDAQAAKTAQAAIDETAQKLQEKAQEVQQKAAQDVTYTPAASPAEAPASSGSKIPWWAWLAGGAALLGGAWYFTQGKKKGKKR